MKNLMANGGIMKKYFVYLAGSLLILLTQVAAGTQQEAGGFQGSVLLIIAILTGLLAVGFAFYSAYQLQGGKMGEVLMLLGVSLLILDLGVVIVTLFAINQTTILLHDFSLLVGFAIAFYAFNKMRKIVS